MKKIFAILLLISVFTLTACGGKENTNESGKNNNSVETNVKDYSGVYKSDDSSELEITKENDNYKVNITIFRTGAFIDCDVYEIKDNVLYIDGIDYKFSFDYNTKILTALEASGNWLTAGDSFVFDK